MIEYILSLDSVQLRNIATAIGIFAGVVIGLIGLPFLVIRSIAAARTARAALAQAEASHRQAGIASDRATEDARARTEALYSDLFAQGIEHIQKSNVSARLAGIALLGRVARESRNHYWPIMQAMTSYLREISPVDEDFLREQIERHGDELEVERPEVREYGKRIEAQAVVDLIRYRNLEFEENGRFLDFSRCDLQQLNFSNSMLNQPNFHHCNLYGASFNESEIIGGQFYSCYMGVTEFIKSTIDDTWFSESPMVFVSFAQSHLKDVSIVRSDCRSTVFSKSIFENLTISHADVHLAVNLTDDQLKEVHLSNGGTLHGPSTETEPEMGSNIEDESSEKH